MKKNNKQGFWAMFLTVAAVVALLAVAGGYFYASTKGQKDVLDKPAGLEPAQVNLLEESVEAHRRLDKLLLQKNNWQLVENSLEEKELEVVESGNKVTISQRDLAIGVPPSSTLTGAAAWVQERIEPEGLVLISSRSDYYHNYDAYRIEVGVRIKAGDGTMDFPTDTLTFFHNHNLEIKDRDVKPVPEAKPAEKHREEYNGRLAIIVDDCGTDMNTVRALLNINIPFSFAILPEKPFSSDILSLVNSKKRIAMLHLPMEPMDKSQMSEGTRTIQVGMSSKDQVKLLQKHLNGLFGVAGVNNHQGSRATADEKTMTTILKELQKRDLFFVDSRTSSKSVAKDKALELGVSTARNDVFLDNSSDVEEIRKQIYKAMELAHKQGTAIAICHARVNTVKCWQKYGEEFKATGITFVPVTELLY